jgi:hypothetical protein
MPGHTLHRIALAVVSNGIDSFDLGSPLNLARSEQGQQKQNFKLTLSHDSL